MKKLLAKFIGTFAEALMTQNTFTANGMSSATSPSTTWKEELEPGEQELFERFARNVLMARQREVSQRTSRPVQRALHMKIHAGLMAEFRVLPDLPEHARFGVFSEPRVFSAVVRFSNGESFNKPDKEPQPRGIAIKLVGVPGPKLLEDQKEAVTQDFLATSHSVTSTVRHVRQFIALMESNIEAEHARLPLQLPFILARKLGVSETARILIALVGTVVLGEVRSLATERYFSLAPIKFGLYAVKFTVQPAAGTEPAANRPQTDDFLREELTGRLRTEDLMFDFLVQFYVNERLTPIEDSSIPWTVEHAPFVTVARLRIPKCDLSDPRTKALSEAVNRLSFSPWHTTEDHRPLGNVMRARKVAYRMSSDFRHHDPEPTSLPL
jgi:hypothetical protein